MRKKSAVNAVSILVTGAFCGCASIIQGTKQKVYIDSTPPAKVFVDNRSYGQTPATYEIKRKVKKTFVRLEKDGCKAEEIEVNRRFSAWYLGNFIFGGAIGLIIDAANGAMWKQEPPKIDARLNCLGVSPGTGIKEMEGREIPLPRR